MTETLMEPYWVESNTALSYSCEKSFLQNSSSIPIDSFDLSALFLYPLEPMLSIKDTGICQIRLFKSYKVDKVCPSSSF